MDNKKLEYFLKNKNDNELIDYLLDCDFQIKKTYRERKIEIDEDIKCNFEMFQDLGFEIGVDYALFLLGAKPIFERNFDY